MHCEQLGETVIKSKVQINVLIFSKNKCKNIHKNITICKKKTVKYKSYYQNSFKIR